jgi:hypothetical protein
MKVMLTWSARSGQEFSEAVRRFLAGEAVAEPGQKILGRWHSVDLSIGFTLYESDDSATHYAAAAKWADVLDLRSYLVVEDAEVGPILAGLKR